MKRISTRKRPLVRYFGGKHKLAGEIIPLLPAHKIYVEPFGGGGSVLLQKPRSYAEVYNDIFEDVVNVFRVVRDRKLAKRLRAACELTPYSYTEFREPVDRTEPVEWARQIIFKGFAGFGSGVSSNPEDSDSGFRADCARPYSTPAHNWANWPQYIPAFTKRLQGVVVHNRSAQFVMRKYDGPDTLFYVDPPYMEGTRSERTLGDYAHEMTDAQHEDLLIQLKSLSGKVALSGYMNDLYMDHLQGWRLKTFRAHTNVNSVRTECLWMNYPDSQLKLFV